MSVRRPGLTVAALAASAGLLSACSQEAAVLDSAAAAPLHERVQAARAALADNDGAEARQALDSFRTEVERLTDAGGINAEDAQVLVAYSEQIEAGLPAGRTAESTAPRLGAPRGLGDVTAPAPALPDPAPARPAPPAQEPATVPAPQNDDDDDDVVEAPEPDAPGPNDPDPGEEDPGNEEPAPDSGDEDPAPEDPAPDDPQPDDPAPGDTGDTGGASDGAGE